MTPAARELVKRIASILYVHRQDNQDTFIHSTQRSGSTMLFDALAAQPGMKAVGEPFQERKHAVVARYLQAPRSRYGSADSATTADMVRYLAELGSGRFVGGYERTYNIASVRHHFRTTRNVYKLLRTLPMTADLREAFPDASHLVLIRHPMPTVLSRVRNGWNAPLEDFLGDETFMRHYAEEPRRLVSDLGRGDAFSRHLAVWMLEHAFLTDGRRALAASGVPVVAFEHVVADRARAAEWIANRTGLVAGEVARRLELPSRSTRHSTTETGTAIESGDTDWLISSWLSRAEAVQLDRCRAVLDAFGFTGYAADRPQPQDWLARAPWQ